MDRSAAPAPAPAAVVGNGHGGAKEVASRTGRGGWSAAIFIIFVEVAERFAYYGLAGNLMMYLTNHLGQSLAGAAQNVNVWVGVSAIFPLVGAFVADSYLGRLRTIIISSLIYLAGMILLISSVSVMPSAYRRSTFFTALYIIAVGEGGHKPCVQTFAADQFDEDLPEEKIAKSSFFNWWYLGITAGATTAVFLIPYLQEHVAWSVGFGLLAGMVAMGLAIFLAGLKIYRRQGPLGSPFTRVAQVFVAAARKWRVEEAGEGHHDVCCDEEDEQGAAHEDGRSGARRLARTPQFRALDKATVIDAVDAASKARNSWRLCTVTQVEEAKLILRLTPIWFFCLMFTVVQAQMHTFFTKQGSSMSWSHFRLAPASLQGLVGLTILVSVPLYDRVFVPLARKVTKHPSGISMLQRIGFGLFLSILNMAVSATVESRRVQVAIKHDLTSSPKATVPMSVWWLLPQYVLCGISDVFAIVGLQELFYDQMPDEMRSLGAGLFISVVGFGSFASTAIISVVQATSSRAGHEWLGNNINTAHLDYYYWVLAGLSGLNLCAYVVVASRFVYKRVNDRLAFKGEV
ncbi:hypothetical protein BT93_J0812 [Corymbia citriodora subsp. variegata]|nr:hypothetical protein BT93_J0812 [Corymbia citriodora subsp. variegata]